MDSNAEVHSSDSSIYDFIGDIQWLIPLQQRYSKEDGECALTAFPADPEQWAYIHISGVAMNVQRSEAKFDLDIEQYVSCMKDALKSASSQITKPIKPIAPISCTIPDSPKNQFPSTSDTSQSAAFSQTSCSRKTLVRDARWSASRLKWTICFFWASMYQPQHSLALV